MNAVTELEEAYNHYKEDPEFNREAEGFVYGVGSSDTAWAGKGAASDVESMIRLIKKEKEIPCAVDFDISTPNQAEAIAKKAEG